MTPCLRSATLVSVLLLWVQAASAQPAAREFYRKSANTVFVPQNVLDARGRRAAGPLIAYLEQGGGPGGGMALSALQVLAKTGHPRALEVLGRYLGDQSPLAGPMQAAARSTIIDRLAEIDTPGSRKLLAEALGVQANKMYASNIIKHCGRLHARECGPAIQEYIRREKVYYDDIVINLAQCDPGRAVVLIESRLQNRKRQVLYDYEILALGVAGEAGGERLLLEQAVAQPVKRWSSEWAVNMAWALGRLQNRRKALPVLRELLGHRHLLVVYQAAVSLAARGDRQSLGPVREAAGGKLSRDVVWVSDGGDSDWGFFRRERIRQIEYDLAMAYARAALGERTARKDLRRVSAGDDPAAAMLADVFLVRLGDKQAASRIAKRIETAARNGFGAVATDIHWTQSLWDALHALMEVKPGTGTRVASMLASGSHWLYRQEGVRALSSLPASERRASMLAGLGRGSYADRAGVRDRIRMQGTSILDALVRATPGLDLDGRTLAVSLLGEFDDQAGARLLRRLARRDPAWQVCRLARRSLAVRQGRDWPPRVEMPAADGGYVEYPEAVELAGDPIGGCAHQGRILAVGKKGFAVYDGYQWRAHEPAGLCSGPHTAAASHQGKLLVFSRGGLALGGLDKLRCRPWKHPPVRQVLADGRHLLLGTDKGLYRFDGRRARKVPGTPERAVRALARQGRTLWAAFALPSLTPGARQQPAVARATLPASFPPALYRYEAGRFQPVVNPLVAYEGWRIPMEVHALAAAGTSLVVGCSEGLLEYHGKKWTLIDDRQGYDVRYGVDALISTGGGVLVALQGLWIDRRDGKGVWHRDLVGNPAMQNAVIMARRTAAGFKRSNGDAWLVAGACTQYGHKLVDGVLLRVAGDDPGLRSLPPETLFVMAKAGEWRWDNPHTRVEPPDTARVAGSDQPVEIPAAQATIEAAAQDPWDYERVEFQFKLDERPWGRWQKDSAILTPLLGEGRHVIRVRARDASGHLDPTPAALHFTVHTRELAVVRILDGKFQDVFPAQYRRYQREGVGSVEVENRATQPLELKLNLKLRDLFDTPATRTVVVPAGERKKVSLLAPFNDKVLGLSGGEQVQAVVEVEFEFEGIQREVRRTFPLRIRPANAIDWSRPGRLAGFINSADPQVERMGSAVYRSFSRSGAARILPMRNLALAAYLFRALDAYGVRYKPDPDSPFAAIKPGGEALIDTVRFPGQTLEDKAGDCDDLVVLFASLLEQVGVRAAVVPVEGHVFVMFDTGVLVDNRGSFRVPDELLVERGGALWAPVEVTHLGRGHATFDAAWAAGAEAYQSTYRPRPDAVVEVRLAWQQTPPAVRPAAKPLQIGLRVAGAARDEVAGLLQGYRQVVLDGAPKGDGPASLLERGRLLAKNGMFEQAREVLERAAGQQKSFDVTYALGVVHAGMRETPAAVSAFEQARELARDNRQRFRASIALASTLRAAGRLERARAACDRALGYNPAARFDARYAPMIRFLRSRQKTKAGSEAGPPPYFQLMLAGME